MADPRGTVLARFKGTKGLEDKALQAITACLAPTRAEAGCVNCDLHRSQEDEGTFVLYENWVSRKALDEHLGMPYLRTLKAKARIYLPRLSTSPSGKKLADESVNPAAPGSLRPFQSPERRKRYALNVLQSLRYVLGALQSLRTGAHRGAAQSLEGDAHMRVSLAPEWRRISCYTAAPSTSRELFSPCGGVHA